VTNNIVCKLLKLVLVLHVASTTVERVFSSMNYVKNKLRNKMGGLYLNDCLVTYIEKEFFVQVKSDAIVSWFQACLGEPQLCYEFIYCYVLSLVF
jgi:hypothetical protein